MPATGALAWLSAHQETIGKAIGTIVVIGGVAWSHVSSKRVPKSWTAEDAKGAVAPMPVTPPDPARAEMRALLDEVRRESIEVRTMAKLWRQDEAEAKLAELVPELRATKSALVEARAMNTELLRIVEQQRLQIAQLQLALDNSEDVLEVVPADSDWAETTPVRRKIKR